MKALFPILQFLLSQEMNEKNGNKISVDSFDLIYYKKLTNSLFFRKFKKGINKSQRIHVRNIQLKMSMVFVWKKYDFFWKKHCEQLG